VQWRDIRTRFFTGARVYNAVLGEFIGRSRAVKSDAAWQSARQLPRGTKDERAVRRAAFDAVAHAHGFTAGAAQSFASALRKSWVREHLPAQETQNVGARAFDAVEQWHLGRKGKPRFKSTRRGLHSLAAKDGHGALRPKLDAAGRLIGLQWGAGFVIPVASAAESGRRGKEQQAELAEIEALIAARKVLSARIVRRVINGRDTYRIHMVCDGHPSRRHPVADGRVAFDLGPSEIAIASSMPTGRGLVGWNRWRIGSAWTAPGCGASSGTWTANTALARRIASAQTERTGRAAASGTGRTQPSKRARGWPSCTAAWPSTVKRCTGRWPIGCSPTVSTSRARTSTTPHGRRTFRKVCGTGHPGCSWRRSDARLKASAVIASTSSTPQRPPSPKPVCAETAGKSCSPNGSTAASAASKSIGTCSRLTWDCTSG